MGENQQDEAKISKLTQAMKNATDRVKFAVASVLFLNEPSLKSNISVQIQAGVIFEPQLTRC